MADRDISKFAGENYKSNKDLGIQSLVTVDLFKRPNGTFFMRVSLRSDVKRTNISRYEIDLDRHTNESDFLREVEIAGGALAGHQSTLYGDQHDPSECAKAAREAAREILRGD
jgi:hypothetical protein